MTYTCNACGGEETAEASKSYGRSYVCPWCGEGVMKPDDSESAHEAGEEAES